jgi:hypothetical protein
MNTTMNTTGIDSNGKDVELESSELTFTKPKIKPSMNKLISSVISRNSNGSKNLSELDSSDYSKKMAVMEDVRQDNNNNDPPRRMKNKRIARNMSHVHLPRLITRDYPYNQSSSRVEIFNKNTKLLRTLLINDWFHILLRYPSWVSIPLCLVVWYTSIWVWAAIYVAVDGSDANLDRNCGLGDPGIPMSMGMAFAFSLETCTTVGYGLPGSKTGFFKQGCNGIQAAITFQLVWSMLYNAFLVSFFFALLSKSENRSIQVIFSNKLCINVIDGKVCANVSTAFGRFALFAFFWDAC